MAKPVLVTVDDDPNVLRAVERDLRRQYGSRYRIVRADSGTAALDALSQLRLRNEAVALFLVDQRMPQMSGVEFLERAKSLYPEAKRALLTAYADTDAAIRAINTAHVDYYLMKPWDPPEDNLYPVLTDLLEDWQASYRPPFEGVRVIGHRWSAASHQIKDFLARNQVPYQWLDVESDKDATQLMTDAGVAATSLPVVLLPNGTVLSSPTNVEIAENIGLQTRTTAPFSDLIIVGAGPAGLAAAVYGASEGLSTILIERQAPGGQAGTSSRIENYLGFPSGLTGADLARRALTQARRFGVEVLTPQEVVAIRPGESSHTVVLSDGTELLCHSVLIATGVSYRKLEVPGIERLVGAGVYYGAAMTEALACQNEPVHIVGGANSAGQAAVYFARYAKEVSMLVRGDSLTKSMSHYLIDQIASIENINVMVHSSVVSVQGENHLETVTIANKQTGEEQTVPSAGLFIFIGAEPCTDWLEGIVERDERGFVLSGPDLVRDGKLPKSWNQERAPYLLETSVPGIFVAGDVRHGSIKRVASGVGEGSISVKLIHQYINKV